MNDYKYACVVDANGFYKTLVVLFLTESFSTDADTPAKAEWVVQSYKLADGDILVETQQPGGMLKPRWTGTTWEEAATAEEIEAADTQTVEDVRREVLYSLSSASYDAIVAGCDVVLSDGATAHFSLQETDQINLTAAVAAVEQGATGYPYHADRQLCRLFPSSDIMGIAQAATAHKLYHTTYANHCNVWARRAESKPELRGIVSGVELPADLAQNMAEVLASASAL